MDIDSQFSPLTLVFVPSTKGRYDARLGDETIARSRQPFFDGARALLAQGHPPDTPLEGRHAGSDIVALRSTIGEAAKWTVHDVASGRLQRRAWAPFKWNKDDDDES